MDEQKIDRINVLARKAKSPEGLTPDEQAEQQALRTEYVAAVKRNLTAQLENTSVQYPDGTVRPLVRKDNPGQ